MQVEGGQVIATSALMQGIACDWQALQARQSANLEMKT
jgi:hypothetical protein